MPPRSPGTPWPVELRAVAKHYRAAQRCSMPLPAYFAVDESIHLRAPGPAWLRRRAAHAIHAGAVTGTNPPATVCRDYGVTFRGSTP